MNGIQISAALAFALMAAANADTRVFTDAKGREIKAEVYMLRGPTVTLTREDGKRFALQVGTLSEADRTYLAEWAKGLPRVKFSYRFRAEKGKVWGIGEVENQNWYYGIELRNLKKTDASDLKMRCSIYKTAVGRKPGGAPEGSYLEPSIKTIEIPYLGSGATVKFRTVEVPVSKHKPLQSADSKFGASSDWSERLAGIRVEILHGGRVVDVHDHGRLPAAGK